MLKLQKVSKYERVKYQQKTKIKKNSPKHFMT